MEKYIETLFIVYSFKFKSTEIFLAFFFRCLSKHAYHSWFTLDLNARFFPIVKLSEKKNSVHITDLRSFVTFRTSFTILLYLSRCVINGDESAIGTLVATFIDKSFSVRVETTCGKKTLIEQFRSYMT